MKWLERIKIPASALLVCLIAMGLYAFDPRESKLFPKCPVFYLFGLHCPGCGSLRASHALLHGKLINAFRWNPLMIVSIPLLLFVRLRRSSYYPPWFFKAVLWTVLAYMVLRNISVWPFVLLAPWPT